MGFGDLQSASRMRDVIESIAVKVVNRERPSNRIGRIQRFNPSTQQAWILFPGENEDTLVKARFARNMIPTKSIEVDGLAVADIVRVSGRPGAYWIVDFLKGIPKSDYSLSVTDAASKVYVADEIAAHASTETPHSFRWRDVAGTWASSTFAVMGYNKGIEQGGIIYDTPTGKWTVPKAGVYSISGKILFASNTTGYRNIIIQGSGITTTYSYTSPDSSGVGTAIITEKIYLAEGAEVWFQGRQTSGGNLDLNINAAGHNAASIAWIGS